MPKQAILSSKLPDACDDLLPVDHQPTVWRGALADCGTLGGMDAANEPPWTGSRRVPRAVRAPRPRPTQL
ncbi:hypothetical protein XAP412_1190092 [Xanthomonas phaseoli pv. phaseoli]|uniref:Uncharacterized protein n=1 Tax=Xanthomonas campestris pv. phaseoli TaxID=317013 RepID=A0AB38DVR7_XANCH|nr:hypothetical protein XAP6984_1230094 [Xanthomonas phaseoli pv. phaseoli]SON76977.1 hypothetical protein XAP412_1190092 [Xanthomonas phaseoli pv. phaseoli]SON81913.1 hypothetical protein XAP7430_1200094 [Xanthomonas phaseoli pv. phaseoli]SOO31190.1 hypothetical protein XAP6164_5100036 [Xanthomonas phaseoli pv. phaseoli]